MSKIPIETAEFAPSVGNSSNPLRVLLGIWENPIFVKFKRSRLRRAQFFPAAVVVLVLTLCIGYGGYELNGFATGGVHGTLITLQTIILAVMGATQIGSAVGGARESGIMDYHRVTPMSPLALALGFFFGAPIREYLLLALTIPLSLVCVAYEAPDILGWLSIMVVMFVSAWLLHGLALLTALTTKKPKVGGRGAIGLIVFLFIFGGNIGFFAVSRATRLVGTSPVMSFYGQDVIWIVYTLLHMLPPLFFILLAAVRKMRSEKAHPFTKPEAVAALLVFAFLLVGSLWNTGDLEPIVLALLYAMIVVASILIATVTPNRGEYMKGVRRALREHHLRPNPWSDWALNRMTVVIFAAIILIVTSFAASVSSAPLMVRTGGVTSPSYSFSVTIAAGVFVVAYVGLAFQAFQLMSAKRGTTYFALFLFLAWLVPLLVGAIVSAGGVGQVGGEFILSLSPVAGLALSAGMSGSIATQTYQAATLFPAIIFAFVFNNLVVINRRKAEVEVRMSEMKPIEPTEVEPLI